MKLENETRNETSKGYKVLCNILKFCEILWGFVKYYEVLSNIMKFYEII